MQLNVDWLYHLPAPVRRAAYFGLQEIAGFRISSSWREFQLWGKFSPSELDRAVQEQLTVLLSTAAAQSSHYRRLGLTRKAGENVYDFLQRFPVLTRAEIREDFKDLVIDSRKNEITATAAAAGSKTDWLIVKTGGTTGVPTAVVHDIGFRNAGRATRLASQQFCGFPLGTRYFRLWGSEQDLLQQQEKLDRRILCNLLGEIPMNAFRAREKELYKHWKTLHANPEVQHMMAYVDAAVSLALFIQERRLEPPKLKTIMACAGTVTPEWRQILKETFSAEVFDKYGSRECSDIACECSAHDGLHVFSPNVYVEIVDEKNERCPPGKPGRIIVTLLNNFIFPMIRYEIGDIGIRAEPGSCSCGCVFPRIQSLQGRQDDMLMTEEGTLLSSVFIRHFVGVSLNRNLIREWQLEQTASKQFVFRYVPLNEGGLAENLRQLQESFKTALGQNITIQLERVAEIPLSATGKMRWIINHCKK